MTAMQNKPKKAKHGGVGQAAAAQASPSSNAAAAAAAAAGLQTDTLRLLPDNIPLTKPLLKILRQIETTQDPLIKQQLQHTFQQCMGKPPGGAAAAAGGKKRALAAVVPGAGAAAAAAGSKKLHAAAKAGTASVKLKATPAELARRQARAARFLDQQQQQQQGGDGSGSSSSAKLIDRVNQGGYGTNTTLEKEYLRLTVLPDAADVRPPEVLSRALALVKQRWAGGASYEYACTQLKSIRQDLRVQHIQGPLAVDAYETHSRVAIEVGDLPELRQCVAVLKQLFAAQPGGLASCPDAPEFYAYSLLAAAGQEGRVLAFELASVPQQLLDHAYVQHALRVISALRSGQYLSYYAAYADAPRMAPYLLDHWLPRVRSGALRALLAAYHPTALPLAAVAAALGMDDVQEVIAYCRTQGAVVDVAASTLDTKASRAAAAAAAAHS